MGTTIIAIVGYGLALVMAYECAAFTWRVVFVDGLDGTGNGGKALGAGLMAMAMAFLTRWLIGW